MNACPLEWCGIKPTVQVFVVKKMKMAFSLHLIVLIFFLNRKKPHSIVQNIVISDHKTLQAQVR